MNAIYKIYSFALALLISCTAFAQNKKISVNIEAKPLQEMTYGMDFERLWSWNFSPEEEKKLAELSVKECKVQYVRVGIDGGSEFEEGNFNWDSYSRQLKSMYALKAANPNVKFFASPRPIHEAVRDFYGKGSPETVSPPFSCFPLWIGVFENPFEQHRRFLEFRWQKAADYMVRQLKFLQSKGFNIAYMDVKNENDRYYFPAELAKMTDSIRKQMGNQMPKVIAPSSYDKGGCVKWLDKAIAIKRTDFFDIIGCHNTKNTGSFEELKEFAKKLNKPLWNTELHGFVGPDDKAAQNTMILWEHIRAGFGGINDWLSLGNAKKDFKMFCNVGGKLEVMRTYYIFKQLVNTSGTGYYLDSNVPEELASVVSFIKAKTLTVWILNTSEEEVKNVEVNFRGLKTASMQIEVMSWGPKDPREGVTGKIACRFDSSSFISNIKGDTLYCFTIKIK